MYKEVEWTDQEITDLWRCKMAEHAGQNCFTGNHWLLFQIKRQVKECNADCKCWRHAVLRTIGTD